MKTHNTRRINNILKENLIKINTSTLEDGKIEHHVSSIKYDFIFVADILVAPHRIADTFEMIYREAIESKDGKACSVLKYFINKLNFNCYRLYINGVLCEAVAIQTEFDTITTTDMVEVEIDDFYLDNMDNEIQ